MAIRADDIIDRRRLRRKLTFWRVAALLVAALAIGSASMWLFGKEFRGTATNHIAKVRIEGTITEDEDLLETLRKVRESSSVRGVILSIDSPGEERRLAVRRYMTKSVCSLGRNRSSRRSEHSPLPQAT